MSVHRGNYKFIGRLRLSMDPKERFPEKLYDVVNDGVLVCWNSNGSVSLCVDEEVFEKNVQICYPGFLQIPTFLNFRRLFREYGFDWRVNDEGNLEFSHPGFDQNDRSRLTDVKTKRKSFQTTENKNIMEPVVIDAEPGKRYSTRRRKRVSVSEDKISNTDLEISHLSTESKRQECDNVQPQAKKSRFAPNLNEIKETFARNEFTEDEYLSWMSKESRFIKNNNEASSIEPTPGYEWMYYNGEMQITDTVYSYPGNIAYSSSIFGLNKMPLPCGLCQCCIALLIQDRNLVLNLNETEFTLPSEKRGISRTSLK
ncbi:hypothetical protein CHS0354_015293 [Potamilus streckersoni]|uniref:HSF-type DNA-binding domain-containing protein n=1 Tax=Potamilus streckersoni TaxID=2493646 RepID=A0AAE0VM77_9BIVA|nr:hypothetical protein CHS0354_015293 [Potamilus streckersoni]